MNLNFLSPEAASNFSELAKSSYRPKKIVDLKEKIKEETRAAKLNASTTGSLNPNHVQKIVKMKLELKGLYADWAKGKLS